MLGYLKLEVLRILRDGGYLMMNLVSPLTMYLVFTNIDLGGQGHRDAAIYSMVGMAAWGAVGAVLTNGVAIAEDKALGWIRQLRLLPLHPMQVVTARTLCAMIVAVPPIAGVCLAGGLVNGVSLSAGQWTAIGLLLWIGVAPIAALGLGIGYLFTPTKAQAVGMIGYMGLSLLGGLWVPVAKLPRWAADVAPITPINRYGELSWRIAYGHAPLPTGVGVLTAWFAAFAVLAVAAYRWSSRRA